MNFLHTKTVNKMTVEKRSILDLFTGHKRQKLKEESEVVDSGKKVVEIDKVQEKTTKKIEYISRKSQQQQQQQHVEFREFKREEFIAGLSEEVKMLLDLEISTMDPSWFEILHEEITKPYFIELKKFLLKEWDSSTPIFPPKEDIYSWTRLTPFEKVKVLIIGQDPYHNFNQAHGLAFSVKDPKTRVPPSLVNIYKGIKIDYESFEIPKTGDLTKWAKQGVLLLNTCLTVKAHLANSHAKKGWEQFTKAVVKKLIENHIETHGIIVVAWGGPALKMVESIGKIDWNRNLLLKSAHPSPLSARRGFFEGHHFFKCNEWIKENIGVESLIDWGIIDGNSTNSN